MAKKLQRDLQQVASQVFQFLVQNGVATQAQVDGFVQALVGGGASPVVVTPPVVVPPVTTGDVATANTLTPATKIEVLSAGLFRVSDDMLMRTMQTPPTPRKAGVPYQVQWDGRLTPTGPVLSADDRKLYYVRVLASRVTSVDDFGVGNTSDTNSIGVLGTFSHAHMVTPSVTYKYLTTPFNEFKPGFLRSRLNQQSWEEVPQQEWYDIRNIYDIGDLHYFEGWRTVRVFNGKIYAALVHCGQDRKFSTGIACFNESDRVWQKFANATPMVFGLSAPYDKQVRPGLLSVRQNTTLLQDTTSVADARALAAQTEITGLAVNAKFIAVSRAGRNEICIYANSMTETLLATVTTVVSPGEMDFHIDGSLWVVTARGVKGYTVADNGNMTLLRTLNVPAADVLSVGCSPVADVIAVKRGGQNQQTIDYNAAGAIVKSWWELGGYLNGNILFSRTKKWNICLSPLAYQAIDRVPFGGETGSVSFGPDGRRYDTDSGNCCVQCVKADGALGEMIMHQDDRLLGARNLTNPREIVLNNMGFDVDPGPLVGGDPFSRPEGSRGWVPKYNYLAGQDVNAVGDPLDLRTDLTTGRTYLRMVDAAIATGGQGRARMFERMPDNTLRDTGPDNYTSVYGNGGQDTTMLADGTLRSVVFGQDFYQVTERARTGYDANNNPIPSAMSLLPPTPRGAADPSAPYPNKPYGSPTRMPDTAFGDILIGQLEQRPDLDGACHMGFLKKSTGKLRARTWLGTKMVGLTGRGYYPETAPAYGGTAGSNVDSVKLISPKGIDWVSGGGFNGQRSSASDNSNQYFDKYGLFIHEWAQGSLNRGGSINQAPGSAGNGMTLLLLAVAANIVRSFGTDESDAGMGHFRRLTGFDESTYFTFAGADVYNATGLTFGKNIFNKAVAQANTLIRGDSGGVEGNGDFTASASMAVVGGNPYITNIDAGQSAWYDGSNRFLGSFSSTRGVAPTSAVSLRISFPNTLLNTVMVLEGEFLPEDGTIIQYVAPGGTTAPSTTPAANLFDKTNSGNIAGYYIDKNSGALVQAAGWNTTYAVPVTEGKEYSGNVPLANSVWLGTTSATSYISSYENSHVAPAGAKYAIFSTNSSLESLMIVQGPASSVPATYVPYLPTGSVGTDARTEINAPTGPPQGLTYSPGITLLSSMADSDGVIRVNKKIIAGQIQLNCGSTPVEITQCIVLHGPNEAGITTGESPHLTMVDVGVYGNTTTMDGTARQRNVVINKPVYLDMHHCTVETGGGIYVDHWNGTSTALCRVKNIRVSNVIGTSQEFRHAIQISNVHTSGLEIDFFEVYNQPDLSRTEDTINIYNSGGTAVGSKLMGRGFGLFGAYPYPATDPLFTGAQLSADGSGRSDETPSQFIELSDIFQTSACGAHGNIATGNNISYKNVYGVTCGYLPDGRRLRATYRAYWIGDFYNLGAGANNTISGIKVHYERTKDLDGDPSPIRRADFVADPNVSSDVPNPGIDVANAVLLPRTPTLAEGLAQERNVFLAWVKYLNDNGQTCGSRFNPSQLAS